MSGNRSGAGAARIFVLLACLLPFGCRKSLVVYDRPAVPLGRVFEVAPGHEMWAFPTKPGDRYRVWAEWPAGRATLRVGSDHRGDDHDDDDATRRREVVGSPVGAHAVSAELVAAPGTNTSWIYVELAGLGMDPMRVRIDRE